MSCESNWLNIDRPLVSEALRVSRVSGRSFPTEGPTDAQPAPKKSHRTAAVILSTLLLLAAIIVAAPYLSSALRQGYSSLSGSSTTGLVTVTSTGQSNSTGGTSTSPPACSSSVDIGTLGNPVIANGSANIAYPPDYCTLASYALGQINADRAANGTGPVALDYNQAAQQHADSMLYFGYFSHYDTQGYKPYMRYTLLGGRGADAENVAYFYYSVPHFTSTGSVESAIQELEHSMVYNDSACCNNGHKYNILDQLHNRVSIGVAYNSTYVYFDEEFENVYVNLTLSMTSASSSNPFFVTLRGVPTQSVAAPNSIYIAFDDTPSPENATQLNAGPHEYGPGSLVGGVLPPGGLFGGCGQFSSGTTVCAQTWTFTSSTVDIAFSLADFVRASGPGVYTVYLITGSSTESAITTISLFVS
jgi:uncharacterized protein YkwD